ncbi:ATP-dependent sacrificial sulfur transferase LarE [Botrimarina sp.]|uniref:ATP-dependent sacrificial sulfur transferase LarE n=1 Tax=Botrimarina sp. TaxID=2795802 RepID=UPI0032EC8B98
MPEPLANPAELADRLTAAIRPLGSCAVAFSAGVDSSVVARAARIALGDRAVAVIGVGAALPDGELEAARRVAAAIGIELIEEPTEEILDPQYQANAPNRCYHCKTELYTHVRRVADRRGVEALLNGANADDRGDHRPGMQAANEHGVRSPLLECGLGKQQVRELARHWRLEVWDKPAAPCLASRIAYGVQVTPERLVMVDRAEQRLRELGLRELRVRLHDGPLARIEVPADAIPLLASADVREPLLRDLRELGFKRVTLDLAGFESGNLNTLVPVESLTAPTAPRA